MRVQVSSSPGDYGIFVLFAQIRVKRDLDSGRIIPKYGICIAFQNAVWHETLRPAAAKMHIEIHARSAIIICMEA